MAGDLIPKVPPSEISEIDPSTIYDIPMEEVYSDDDFNVRGTIIPASVMELARDIRVNGLLQPITVQPYSNVEGKKYRIIAGHRRHLAHMVNEAKYIRGIFKLNLTETDAVIFNLIENTHRQELNMYQEAIAIQKLKQLMIPQEEVARRVGKSRGWVQTRFRILELPHEIQEEVAKGMLTASQIQEVHELHDEEAQYELVRKFKDAKLFGKNPDRLHRPKIERADTKKPRSREEIFEMQDMIREALGNSLTTVILGWAGGEVDNYDAQMSIAEEARSRGMFYAIPQELKPEHNPESLASKSEVDDSEPPAEEPEFEPMEGEATV